MGDLSLHFSTSELCCPHCKKCILDPRLVPALEKLRALVNKPINIHDGYRCPEHNKAVGGVKNSEHVRGMAADIDIPGLTLQEMYDAAEQIDDFHNGGIGVYDGNFIHVDVRLTKARWSRKNNQYLALGILVTPFKGEIKSANIDT